MDCINLSQGCCRLFQGELGRCRLSQASEDAVCFMSKDAVSYSLASGDAVGCRCYTMSWDAVGRLKKSGDAVCCIKVSRDAVYCPLASRDAVGYRLF